VQARTKAVIVVKRGSRGCRVHAAAEGRDALALAVDGFAVDVFNVLGAGDAFMAGFLDGWLRGAPLLECARRANACGALVVSRHGCAPAMPSAIELEHFLHHGSAHHRLRDDPVLAHLHRVTTRAPAPQRLAVLAFDHRTQLEELAAQCGAPPRRIEDFKRVIALAAARVGPGPHARGDGARDIRGGLILDDRYGAELLPELDDAGWWIARPVEAPGSRPLRFERDRDLHAWLREWPSRHVAKCLIALDPADPSALIADQLDRLRELVCACITTQRELLLEVIPPQWETRPDRDAAVHGAIEVITRAGVRPDWWKLPPAADERGWSALQRVITAADPYCRGVLVLGLDAPIDELESQLAGCAAQPICRGFAVGRSIFGDAARAWFLGQIGEAEAIDSIARRYLLLLERFGHAAAARGAVAAVASDAPVPSLQLRPA
jgi:5-dehydro-2-deoxygluconokinase